MLRVDRFGENPILRSDPVNAWEGEATFNPSVIISGKTHHMAYRALSRKQAYNGIELQLSTIGYARSSDGFHFDGRRPFIVPEKPWEQYGCEDPRITTLEGSNYIFYTAIGAYPPGAGNIKIAVAKTKDFISISEKHLVTPFNAKAMALFPDRVNGKLAVIFSAHTDMPPSYMCIAYLDQESDLWNEAFWNTWHKNLEAHVLGLFKNHADQLEVGAVPIKTKYGWLLVYCHIQNYFSRPTIFRIDAALLDLDNPLKVLGQTTEPLLIPEEEYEHHGMVSEVIFPSGATVVGDQLRIYYGGADTVCCVATTSFSKLLDSLKP